MYYVYVHTVPNGKVYVGQTSRVLNRWNNGEGYIKNKEFYNDIQKYGWNNIKHEIVATYFNQSDAITLETSLIIILKAEDENYGYNKTTFYKTAHEKYIARKEFQNFPIENTGCDSSFFQKANLPYSACKELIDQWIFNEEHRQILKSRLLDGLSYEDISKKHKKSVRQCKTIVYNNCPILEKHF